MQLAHADGDAARLEDILIVLAGVRPTAVRVVKKACVREPELDRLFEGADREVVVVRRAHRPANDEAREEVEHDGKVELGAAADNEFGGIAQPAGVRRRCEVAVKQLRRDRVAILGDRRALESPPLPRHEALGLHQPDHPFRPM
jgi:hypothetical protein